MIALLLVIGLGALPVHATSKGFTITSNWNYGNKSAYNPKEDYNLTAVVNWNSSNKASHNEWFQIVNSNNEARSGEYLFPYLASDTIPEYSSLTHGYYYYLRACREHIVDPSTIVSGTWEP